MTTSYSSLSRECSPYVALEVKSEDGGEKHAYEHISSSITEPSSLDEIIQIDVADKSETTPVDAIVGRIPGIVWVFVWFVLNVALAVLMKTVFSNSSFKFPVLMSTVHMIVSALFSQLMMLTSAVPKQEVSAEGNRRLMYFVFLFCLNIAFGNIAVEIVNLPLSQLIRSSIPIFIMVISRVLMNVTPSLKVGLSVIPIVVGVAMAAYGDVELTIISFALLIIGNIFAALKVVVTNKSLTEYKLHPMVMLGKLSPASSIVMFFFALMNGEVSKFLNVYQDISIGTYMLVLLSGVMAFFLNWTNFLANKHTSPLTMSVLGNVKQALIIGLSILLFHTQVLLMSSVGVVITMIGMMLYTYLTYKEKLSKSEEKKIQQ